MKLRFTSTALDQIQAALERVEQESPKGAIRVRERIAATVDLLVQHPSAGQKTSREGVRRVVLTPYPYIIFYRVRAEEIVIMRFRHAARKPLFRA